MKIIYVAKHNSGGNGDEDAITYSLQKLGHDVICVPEFMPAKRPTEVLNHREGVLLCHKWLDTEIMLQTRIPKVLWYFDLVDFSIPAMSYLSQVRKAWMALDLLLVNLGFCTDGDWVNQDTSGKLVKLTQGADERITRLAPEENKRQRILFAGSTSWGGTARKRFTAEMRKRYGSDFSHLTRDYREALANQISAAKIVVAPDTPSTDNYWSNRVYVMLGFGGFLIHPYCEGLTEHYTDRKEIVYYRCREELHDLIRYYLSKPDERRQIRQAGYERTIAEHTYTHRCAELVKVIQERLF